MNRLPIATIILSTMVICSYTGSALAATCTVTGTILVDSEDEYYCDTTIAPGDGCDGYLEKDYDSNTRPIRGVRVFVVNTANVRSSLGSTNESGSISLSFNSTEFGQSSCSALSVKVGIELRRSTGSGGMFRIVEADGVDNTGTTTQALVKTGGNLSFVSNTASVNWTLGATTDEQHLGTVYQTADRALSEIRSWNTNLNNAFNKTSSATDGSGVFRIVHDSSAPIFANFWPDFKIRFGWNLFRMGATLRHEIGHAVHWEAHERTQNIFAPAFNTPSYEAACLSYDLNMANNSHWPTGCEYGFASTVEGLATFFAVRSIYNGNSITNGWYCFCTDNANADQDECTEIAVHSSTFSDTDRIVDGASNIVTPQCFIGVGDDYSDAAATCARLQEAEQCSCGGDGCNQTEINNLGYQNENQVVRFMWDMIDSHDEGSDDTDGSINTVLAELASMPCTPESSLTSGARDGNCNEPNFDNPTNCKPQSTTAPVIGDQQGTRDSYNIWDLAARFDGDQAGERVLNCVQAADD